MYHYVAVVSVVFRYFMLSFLPRSLSGKGIRMKIVVKETEQEASAYVAEIIGTALREKPELSLSPPTGSTPVHVLKDLVRKHHEEGLSFAKASLFNMDEYLGLGRNHPQGYYHFLDELLYS